MDNTELVALIATKTLQYVEKSDPKRFDGLTKEMMDSKDYEEFLTTKLTEVANKYLLGKS